MNTMEKNEIRKRVCARRDRLNRIRRFLGERKLLKLLVADSEYQFSDYIFCYASKGSEVPTFRLINRALMDGKEVYLPKVTAPRESKMEFYPIRSLCELKEGYQGIPEPPETEAFEFSQCLDKKILVIVPGTAFDTSGHRIGYGKGFYDKYLSRNVELQKVTIGIAYSCQILDSVPIAENDVCMNRIWIV